MPRSEYHDDCAECRSDLAHKQLRHRLIARFARPAAPTTQKGVVGMRHDQKTDMWVVSGRGPDLRIADRRIAESEARRRAVASVW